MLVLETLAKICRLEPLKHEDMKRGQFQSKFVLYPFVNLTFVIEGLELLPEMCEVVPTEMENLSSCMHDSGTVFESIGGGQGEIVLL